MAKMRGKDLYVAYKSATLAGVGAEKYRTFNPQYQIDTIDSSAGDQDSKTYIMGLKDGTATMQIVYEGSLAIYGSLTVGSYGSLVWGPEGTATGKPKGAVNAWLTAVNQSNTYNDLTVLDLTWQFDNDLINDPLTSVW